MRYVITILAILIADSAFAQQTPTPIQKKTTSQSVQPTTPVYKMSTYGKYNGATLCEQIDKVITCNNGFKQTIR